ncbi:MAG: mechanosensitive ion channel family protein [Leptolyngbyaceae bacterium]|nr:mechanosensitive ion channel family protein [Leptolyngbyaceae bacterium]
MNQQGLRFAGLLGLGWLVAFIIGICPVPTSAQLFSQPLSPTDAVSRTNIVVQRQGNIEYADVTLDGTPLFTIAAVVSNDEEPGDRPALTLDPEDADSDLSGDAESLQSPSAVPSIKERVEQIETNLAIALIGIQEFERFRVVVGNLNNQSVIFVSDAAGTQSLQIVTVTDLDVKLAGTTESEVVLDRVNAIRNGLTQALEQRQPYYLWQQAQRSGRVLAIALVLSLAVAYLQRLLKRQWNWLNQCDRDHQLEMNEQMQEELQGTQSMQEFAVLHPLKYLEMRLPRLSYDRKRNINLLIRRLLLWVQISIWLGSIIWTLTKFPQTREIGLWLMQLPVRLLAIVLVMGLIKKLGEVFIDYSLQLWAENESINPTGFHRQACRAPTFSVALKNLLGALCVIAGFIWALYELRVPITPVVASAGIIGFALSLSAQNLLKDIINGCLILWEDQYAVGDVISVGQELGFVEHMTLRITQLRDPDGELVTIPNGSISTVRNLSNGWSRVNFEIEVSYATDVDEAMDVMEQVIEQMRSEPQWGDRIIEPAEILGVDKLAHTGILIRIWIKTRPLQQWNVSREFRRRLKRAFEEHNIPIGVPQQFLWVKNANELAILEQAMQSHQGNGQPEHRQPVTDS